MIAHDGPGEPDEAYGRLFVLRLDLHVAAGSEQSIDLFPIANGDFAYWSDSWASACAASRSGSRNLKHESLSVMRRR
jgi:hypothetical protein